jgi:hypothetical protein
MVLAWTVGASLPLAAQSLADVARQEAERRKAISAAGKVLTNDDVRSRRPLTTAAAAPGSAEAPAPGSETGAAPREGAAAEPAEDRTRQAEDLRRQVVRDRLALETLQARLNGLTFQMEQVTDGDTRAMLERERAQVAASLEGVQADIAQKEQSLQRLESPEEPSDGPLGDR